MQSSHVRLTAGVERQPERSEAPGLQAEEATDLVKWGGTLPSGRRAVIGGLGGLAIGAAPVAHSREASQ